MGLLTKIEDRPTPPCVYNWRVYWSAAVAAFAACTIGYDSAFIGTTIALDSFKSEFGFDNLTKSQVNLLSANIVSCYQAGAFFGAFFAYPAGHFLGRRWGLCIFSVVFILGAGMMLGANGSRGLGLIYGGRVLAGIGVGAASNLSPIYVSEIAPPAIRGRLVGFYEFSWQIGGLVGFWINYGLTETMAPSHTQWLIPFAVQLIPAGLLFAGIWTIRESPRWLFSRSRRQEAIRNLCWLRHLPPSDLYLVEEISAIDAALDHQSSTIGLGFWQPFRAVARNPKIQWRFFLGSMLFLWQNASGINAVNYYSPTIFKSIGVTGTSTSLLTTGLFGCVKTAITILWLLYLIDRLGRRSLLLYGALGGSLCMWYIGGYIAVAAPASHPTSTLTSGGISAIVFFYLWTACYTPSWNGTPWVYNSEMFDQSVRTLAQASAASSNWLWNFLISRFTPQMFASMGYGVYFFFASLMLCSIAFVWVFLPETKGVPLESMEGLFDRGGGVSARKAHGVVMAEVRREEELFRGNLEGSGVGVEVKGLDGEHVEKV
ncbi:MAG: hypothetical protein Q9227_006212 [Pyrenula ochraceoflavens]